MCVHLDRFCRAFHPLHCSLQACLPTPLLNQPFTADHMMRFTRIFHRSPSPTVSCLTNSIAHMSKPLAADSNLLQVARSSHDCICDLQVLHAALSPVSLSLLPLSCQATGKSLLSRNGGDLPRNRGWAAGADGFVSSALLPRKLTRKRVSGVTILFFSAIPSRVRAGAACSHSHSGPLLRQP